MSELMLEVRRLPIDELIPAPYNPRVKLTPKDSAYQKLKQSIQEFGLVEPLIWNETTGHMVGGHARLAILKELGITEVPVSVVRLNSAREKALNVVLNNQEAQGTYDPEKLGELLDELAELPELALTGFDSGTLRQLVMEPTPAVEETTLETQQVSVELTMPESIWEEISPTVDDWVRRLGVRSHIRG